MRQIRKIAFINSDGDRFGLNGEKGVYAMNLSGFGFALDPVFVDLEHGFYPSVYENSEPQGAPAFTLVFTKEPYKTYQSFVDWLFASSGVAIAYNPAGTQEYRRDVCISSLEKGELTKARWLEVSCSLRSRSPWYFPAPAAMVLEAYSGIRGKRYDYRYLPTLSYGCDSPFAWTGRIPNTGHIPGANELIYRGAVKNPRLRLMGVNTGKTYGVCAVDASLLPSDSLVNSSRYENSHVRRRTVDGTEVDLLDSLDICKDPFFHVPVAEPCLLSLTSDAPLTGSAEVQVYYYFRGV